MSGFKKATKFASRLRMALAGPSGSGKTFSALKIGLALGPRVALIDTERGSASKYADLYNFDVLELESFHPQEYIKAIHEAEQAGYDLLIIDSLSHAWSGKDGALELVDRAAKRSQSQNSYVAWREVTPLHNALVDTMTQCACHLIVTMRSKVEYAMQERNGKQVPQRVGMAPIQRQDLEYEFDVYAEMDHDNNFIVQKSRCPTLSGAIIAKPDEKVADVLKAWLTGVPAPELSKAPPVTERPLRVAPKTEPSLNDAMLKRVVITQKECGVSDDAFKDYLTACFSVTSRKLIPVSAVDEVLAWLHSQHEQDTAETESRQAEAEAEARAEAAREAV